MTTRFGYACLNMTLQALKPRITCNRGMIRRTFDAKGLPYASELALQNVTDLVSHVQWNHEHGIEVFRITSCLFPWASEYKLQDLPDYDQIVENLQLAGKLAKQYGQRLSTHPGQYNVLTSPHEHVVQNCITDLEIHGELFDIMGMPRSPGAKINIHIGGSYNDKPGTAKRFLQATDQLSASVYDRLTVENDDRLNLYTTQELHDMIYMESGIPIVFDYHHHACNPGDLSERDALALAISTWQNAKPCTHYSESAQLERGEKAPFRAHSNYIYSKIDDHGFDIDCVVEAKAKEQAVLKYYQDHGGPNA